MHAISDVTLTAVGSITQSVDDNSIDLIADNLTMTAGTGIGLMQIAANSLDAQTTSGSITLVDADSQKEIAGGLTVTRAAAADAVNITAAGNLSIVLATASAATGSVTLVSTADNVWIRKPASWRCHYCACTDQRVRPENCPQLRATDQCGAG
ncbi:MAG UNVERIFIED_CONTAM: hypothetical protein LVR18_46775 [Planctomycetaceae bacterium]